MNLQGTTVVVTGGSRGIGLEVARAVLAAGGRVVLAARGEPGLAAARRSLAQASRENAATGGTGLGSGLEPPGPASAGERILTVPTDVTEEGQVAGLFTAAVDRFGRVDALVNAAGVLTRGGVTETKLEDWQTNLAVNLTGVFLCSREAVRRMVAQPPAEDGVRGHLVQIVSGAGVHGWPGHAAYSAAKHGVMGFSASLRDEVREQGVLVSDVLPGMTATAMTDLPDFASRNKLAPEDVAQAVLAVLEAPARAMLTRVDVRHRLTG